MNYDAYGNPIKPKSSGVLVPVVLALLVSAGGNYWLWKERARLSGEAFTATAKLAAAEAFRRRRRRSSRTWRRRRAALVEAKELAVKDAQAKATELAKLKDDVAGVAGVAEDKEPAGAATDSGKAKADDKPAKDATAKADPKADAKSKAKAKAKKKAESHKKESAGSAKPPADREL